MSRRLAVARTLALDLALVEVVGALRERDVACLLLKGPALAQLVYEDPDERGYDDIDLLVAPESRMVAEQILQQLGFRSFFEGWRAAERSEHAEHWYREAPREANVDLHRTLGLVPHQPALFWEAFARDAEALEIAGEQVWVPSAAARALTVALHAAWHGRGRARSMTDLERAVERLEVGLWREALVLAGELGALDGLAAGLRISERGALLADELGLEGCISPYLCLSVEGNESSWRPFEQLHCESSLRARMIMITGELWPSPGFMRFWRPGLARSRPGLVVAYAWRPLWVLLRAPRGYHTWRAAQRDRAGRLDSARRAWWALRSLRRARRGLRERGIDRLELPRPPRTAGGSERGIRWILRHGRATCLERAVIRQTWLHSRDNDHALVIGVDTHDGFRAHAWLDGEEDPGNFTELTRRGPTP